MRRLLQFIYGLITIAISLLVFYYFKQEKEWYRWAYFVCSMLAMYEGIQKLEKSTEKCK